MFFCYSSESLFSNTSDKPSAVRLSCGFKTVFDNNPFLTILRSGSSPILVINAHVFLFQEPFIFLAHYYSLLLWLPCTLGIEVAEWLSIQMLSFGFTLFVVLTRTLFKMSLTNLGQGLRNNVLEFNFSKCFITNFSASKTPFFSSLLWSVTLCWTETSKTKFKKQANVCWLIALIWFL